MCEVGGADLAPFPLRSCASRFLLLSVFCWQGPAVGFTVRHSYVAATGFGECVRSMDPFAQVDLTLLPGPPYPLV